MDQQIDQKKMQFISRLVKINALSLKIHRYLIWFVLVTYIMMGTTGIFIKYRWLATDSQFGFVWNIGNLAIEEAGLRKLHSDYSVYFAFFIGFMILTGFTQYFIPKIIIARNKRQ